MLLRVMAALTALTLVHGADKVARDTRNLAASAATGTGAGALGVCLDRPTVCRAAVDYAGRLAPSVALPVAAASAIPASPDRHTAVVDHAGPVQGPTLSAVALPLPPIRPPALGARKGG